MAGKLFLAKSSRSHTITEINASYAEIQDGRKIIFGKNCQLTESVDTDGIFSMTTQIDHKIRSIKSIKFVAMARAVSNNYVDPKLVIYSSSLGKHILKFC